MAGTCEDARLIVELAKWGAMIGLAEASRTIYSDDFDPDDADVLDPEVQTTLVFHETVGTLVKNDLLDRELVYDWLWVAGSWDRVGKAALAAREKSGVPELFANFEALAKGQSQA
jgi:hypothetical protein